MSFNCKAVRFVCGAVVVFAALLHLSSALPMRAGPARGPFRVKRDAHATHGDATPTPSSDRSAEKSCGDTIGCDALIRKWAPQVRFHPDEAYFPAATDEFMTKSSMWYGQEEDNGIKASPVDGPVTPETITEFYDPYDRNINSSVIDPPGIFRLILREETLEYRQGWTEGPPPPVYVVVTNSTTFYEIVYVFFYLYNGPSSRYITGLGTHEGDIERISVRLRRGSHELMGIYYSAHTGGTWHSPDQISYQGTHPIVYSALSSHANFNGTGETYGTPFDLGITTLYLSVDSRSDGGRVWNTWENVLPVGTPDKPLNGQRWTLFAGKWGRFKEAGCLGFYVPFWGKVCIRDYPDEKGPCGLIQRSWFTDPHRGGPGSEIITNTASNEHFRSRRASERQTGPSIRSNCFF